MAVDIISGVMAAAEPATVTRAKAKLAGAVSRTHFETVVQQTKHEANLTHTAADRSFDLIADVMSEAQPASVSAATLKLAGLDTSEDVGEPAQRAAAKEFESTFWANALEATIPSSEGSLFGGGTAEQLWRGQYVQFLSQAIAERSDIGLGNIFSDGSGKINGDGGRLAEGGNAQWRIRPFAFTS